MNPTVVAAWIAAGVSVLTLVGTLVAQYLGRRATSRDTQEALQEQWKQLDRTLAEQRTRTLNERFATAAGQLGSDKPAVRMAGVHAMAGLADDWEENRQTCVDVLCGYLRMPYEPDPGEDAPEPQRLAFQASRQVRHTVIRAIAAHLEVDNAAPEEDKKEGNKKPAISWQGLNFDFTGAVFDGGDFWCARFSSGRVSFRSAKFSGGIVDFGSAEFSGAAVDFGGARFSGGTVSFRSAKFSRGIISFRSAKFSGATVDFRGAWFSGAAASFEHACFSDGAVNFYRASFGYGRIFFGGAQFTGSTVDFRYAGFFGSMVHFNDYSYLGHTRFPDEPTWERTRFSGGRVDFKGASFRGGRVSFRDSGIGGEPEFSGSEVDFSDPLDWSTPPEFPWTDEPPSGVLLPDTGRKAN